jgi:hypothetical protein
VGREEAGSVAESEERAGLIGFSELLERAGLEGLKAAGLAVLLRDKGCSRLGGA